MFWRLYNRITRWRRFFYLFLIVVFVVKIISFFSATRKDEEELHTLCLTTTSPSDVFLRLAPNPDGVGHVALNIIYGMVYSNYRGWRFVGYRSENNPHNIDTERFLDFIFWKRECYSNSHALNAVPFKRRRRVESVGEMERMPRLPPGTLIESTFLEMRDATADRSTMDHIFTDNVLLDLLHLSSHGVKKELARFSHFQKCSAVSTTVAAHLRWGDFVPGERSNIRAWLFVLLTRIQQLVPSPCVHVFTSVLTHEEEEALLAEMAFFTDAGIAVHVHVEAAGSATEDLISTVAHFIDADVFVMSPSSLSVLAGVLSKGCIVYPTVMKLYPALSHWMKVRLFQSSDAVFTEESMVEEMADMIDALPKCVRNLK